MADQTNTSQALCAAINAVKRSALSADGLDTTQYLGGDLAIDSIEMLEIWFHTEKALGVRIPDEAKRDIYTLADALQVLDQVVAAREAQNV